MRTTKEIYSVLHHLYKTCFCFRVSFHNKNWYWRRVFNTHVQSGSMFYYDLTFRQHGITSTRSGTISRGANKQVSDCTRRRQLKHGCESSTHLLSFFYLISRSRGLRQTHLQCSQHHYCGSSARCIEIQGLLHWKHTRLPYKDQWVVVKGMGVQIVGTR